MNIAVNNYYNRAAVYPQHAKNKTASFAQVLADTASAGLAETTPAKKDQTVAPQKEALLQTWYAGRPLSEWALSDPRYTDEETGISWYVRDGKHPYMTGEDAEKLKQLCEKTGESWLKKFAEMTGTIQKLDENTTAYVGTNGIAVMGKDGRQLSVDTSALSYDMLECLFDNLQRGGNYFDSSYWQNQLQKVF